MAKIDPTAANIISSLGIKGATVSEESPGFVPILDASGKISANLIPANAAELAVKSLSNVAYIDPGTEVAEENRKGSIIAPFKSLYEASRRFGADGLLQGENVAFVLASGKYSDSSVDFDIGNNPSGLFLIGLGECVFLQNQFLVTGISASSGNPTVCIQGIKFRNTVAINSSADVFVLGHSEVNTLNANSGSSLHISCDSKVYSTGIDDVSYLSEASRVGYSRRGDSSSSFPDGTVGKELDRLRKRKIRVSNITGGSNGFDVGSSYSDVSEESSSGVDIFDFRGRDRDLLEGINELFDKGKDIVADTVKAGTVVADVIDVKTLRMGSLALGGYRITIDMYGYLVVADGSATPPSPPDGVILLRDTAGSIYMLGISNGRAYVAPADESSAADDEITIHDPESGYDYDLSMSDGRLIITRKENVAGSGT